VLHYYRSCGARGRKLRDAWQARFDSAAVDKAAWEAGQAGRGL
jgi:hypothetical protein